MSAELDNIDLACHEVKKALQNNGLEHEFFPTLLAVREALANAVIHGASEDASQVVNMRLNLDPNGMTLAVADKGNGFDWRAQSLGAPDPESTSGRGLLIMAQYFDQVVYNDAGNQVTLTKSCQRRPCMSNIMREGAEATVQPGRDIVSPMAQDFRDELKSLIDDGVQDLTVDLNGVELMDSIGMGLLIAAHNSLARNGGKLKLANLNPDILGLLKIMRLDKHFVVLGS